MRNCLRTAGLLQETQKLVDGMKRSALALALILSLLVSTASIHLVSLAVVDGAVPHIFPELLTISMETFNSSKIYSPNSDVVLKFSIAKDIGAAAFYDLYPDTGWFSYSLDDNPNVTGEPKAVSSTVSVITSHHGGPTQIETTRYNVAIHLIEASDGHHKIAVYIGVGYFFTEDSLFFSSNRTFAPFYFNVDACPIIRVASPKNIIYDTADVSLNFTVNEPVSQISYSLDGQENMTIAGNVTLTDLPNGDHNVTVYAQDVTGNIGVSEIKNFSVEVPEPFPTTLVVAASVAVAIAGVGLLVVYFKRRNP
jgi:hypothetical protein